MGDNSSNLFPWEDLFNDTLCIKSITLPMNSKYSNLLQVWLDINTSEIFVKFKCLTSENLALFYKAGAQDS